MEFSTYFSGPELPGGLYWFNEPPEHYLDDGLHIHTRGGTDFWQRTHYGFRRDDGHCLFARAQGNFRLACEVGFDPKTQYDQCGLMIRADDNHWIKVSTEFEDTALSRLGSVVTNGGYSDWATQDVSSRFRERRYRISRETDDFIVEYSDDGNAWRQMRIAHLHNAPETMEAGIYACSPKGEGFNCVFRAFSLTTTSGEA